MDTLKKDFEKRWEVAQAEKASAGNESTAQIKSLQTEVESIKQKYAKDLKEQGDKTAQTVKEMQTRHAEQIKQLSEQVQTRDQRYTKDLADLQAKHA